MEETFPEASICRSGYRTLLVDLNSFATFPTLATGILIATLRKAGHDPTLLVPLAYDVPARERERREWWVDDVMRRIHLSTRPIFHTPRDLLRSARYWLRQRPHPTVLREVAKALDAKPDILMLSAYLHHYPTIVQIGKLAADAHVPMLLGGPAFNLSGVAESWRGIPGLTAIYGGEADLIVHELAEAIIAGENLLRFEGVMLPDGRHSSSATPFRKLDLSPTPDFTDFPWDRYRHWIAVALQDTGIGEAHFDAIRIMALYDIVAHNGANGVTGVFIRNGSPALDKVFQNTAWEGRGWERALRALDGAFKLKDPVYFSGARTKSRCIGIPVDYIPDAIKTWVERPDGQPDVGRGRTG